MRTAAKCVQGFVLVLVLASAAATAVSSAAAPASASSSGTASAGTAALASPSSPRRAGRAAPPSEWGTNGYVEYRPGTGPLVLSAPHGGALKPESIPDRTGGVTDTDSNTIDVATIVQDSFDDAARPHLVICHLARTKLDANREIVEAAEGNPEAELAWEEYHGFIERARAAVDAAYGRGLYVDIHGQSHPENWTECGMLLTAIELNRFTDDDLNDPAVYNLTSLRNLCGVSRAATPATILRGASSVCGLLENYGYAGVPSPTNPSPGTGNYFSGGYSTNRHGSVDGGSAIDGIQVEICGYARRTSDAILRHFSESLASVLQTFVQLHYGL